MIRIGICDDSAVFLEQIKFMIDHWDEKPQTIVTNLFEDGDSLIQSHKENPFDILLLDIMMPLLNGIDAAKEIRSKDKTVKIIFLTTSPEFALDSYSVKASDYLLKPIQPSRLFSCLKELIPEIQDPSKIITVKSSDITYRIFHSNIEYIEAQNKHVSFSLSNGKILVSSDPLYTYDNKLTLADGFFKCHRSYIVNLYQISSFTHKEIIMRSGFKIPISRNYQKDFENIYFSVLFKKAGEQQ